MKKIFIIIPLIMVISAGCGNINRTAEQPRGADSTFSEQQRENTPGQNSSQSVNTNTSSNINTIPSTAPYNCSPIGKTSEEFNACQSSYLKTVNKLADCSAFKFDDSVMRQKGLSNDFYDRCIIAIAVNNKSDTICSNIVEDGDFTFSQDAGDGKLFGYYFCVAASVGASGQINSCNNLNIPAGDIYLPQGLTAAEYLKGGCVTQVAVAKNDPELCNNAGPAIMIGACKISVKNN